MTRVMTARSAIAALVFTGALLGGVPAGWAADSITIVGADASAYPTVVLDVDAPASAGTLSAAELSISENGNVVMPTVTRLTDNGLQVLLLVDTSNSMVGAPLQQAKAAAREFLNALPVEVEVGLIGFDREVHVLITPTVARDEVAAQIDALTTSMGGTRLYDAITAGTATFDEAAAQRAIVVLSDGGDTGSAATLEDAAAAIAGVHVEVVSLETSSSNPPALARLAADGHGNVVSAIDPAGLGAAYATIGEALRNRYQISYQSLGTGDVDVTITTPGGTAVTHISLPAPPPVSTTAAPAVPASVPATASTTIAQPIAAPPPSAPAGPREPTWLLMVGATACFLGSLALAALALPRRFSTRRRQRQLGLTGEEKAPATLSSLGERAVGMMDRALRRHDRHQRIADLLESAGIALRPAEFVTAVAACAAIALLVGLMLGGLIVALVLVALVVLGAFGAADVKAQRRRTRFAEHLADVLQLLVSSLRSGYGLAQALDAVATDAPDPIASELRRVTIETRLGRDIGEALDGVAARMRSPDFEMVVSGVKIHRTVGGNLGEIMENVGHTIRDRQRTARQVQALIAEGKLSAYILTALPLLLAAFMRARNPEYFDLLLHGTGLAFLTVGGALIVVGWIWFQKLIRIKF